MCNKIHKIYLYVLWCCRSPVLGRFSINNYFKKVIFRAKGMFAMNHPHINHLQFRSYISRSNINRLKINCISLVIYLIRNAIRLISIDRHVWNYKRRNLFRFFLVNLVTFNVIHITKCNCICLWDLQAHKIKNQHQLNGTHKINSPMWIQLFVLFRKWFFGICSTDI